MAVARLTVPPFATTSIPFCGFPDGPTLTVLTPMPFNTPPLARVIGLFRLTVGACRVNVTFVPAGLIGALTVIKVCAARVMLTLLVSRPLKAPAVIMLAAFGNPAGVVVALSSCVVLVISSPDPLPLISGFTAWMVMLTGSKKSDPAGPLRALTSTSPSNTRKL